MIIKIIVLTKYNMKIQIIIKFWSTKYGLLNTVKNRYLKKYKFARETFSQIDIYIFKIYFNQKENQTNEKTENRFIDR